MRLIDKDQIIDRLIGLLDTNHIGEDWYDGVKAAEIEIFKSPEVTSEYLLQHAMDEVENFESRTLAYLKEMDDTVDRIIANTRQIQWERDVALDQLAMLGYKLGQKPRVGRWIESMDIISPHPYSRNWRCSECRGTVREISLFCPHCGVRMETDLVANYTEVTNDDYK